MASLLRESGERGLVTATGGGVWVTSTGGGGEVGKGRKEHLL